MPQSWQEKKNLMLLLQRGTLAGEIQATATSAEGQEKARTKEVHIVHRGETMGLKGEEFNKELVGKAKMRAAQINAAVKSNPKMQQGLTADKRKTGIVRAGERK